MILLLMSDGWRNPALDLDDCEAFSNVNAPDFK